MDAPPVIGLTMGDPAGVGPELCLRALNEPSVLLQCTPVLFGEAAVLRPLLARLAIAPPQTAAPAGAFRLPRIVSLSEWARLEVVCEPLLVDCAVLGDSPVNPGEVSAACGRAAHAFIRHATEGALTGRLAAVVTAPIHKQAFRLAGVPYAGHTEMLAALTGTRRYCMMLHAAPLTVSMVTTHVGFADVPEQLSVERVLEVIELTARAVERLRGRARLGVCGLNPHAGEHGLFGRGEEERFLAPAVALARARGLAVEGPLSPDAAFTPAVRQRFDALVTLYHDQGHIPFKMLAFDTGVNLTLGLPIIRTSVDHGTAFDLAWRGVASPQSLFAALLTAARLAGSGRPPRVAS